MPLLGWIVAALAALAAVGAAGHALLYKRDPRASLGWIAACLTLPLVGPLLYFLFGVNRIRTRARKLGRPETTPADTARFAAPPGTVPQEFAELARIGWAVTRGPLAGGNRIDPLHDGEEAYPAMLEAIERAERCVYLSTYIFDADATGRRFVDALARAVGRGVEVRVLIDGIGQLYSWPRASRLLRRAGVPCALFLPPRLLPPAIHINLRNHRKILVADGGVAFTGGMNIGDRHLARKDRGARVSDLHFRLEGPAAAQIEQPFREDWAFVTGEALAPSAAREAAPGQAVCRTIVDGPNEDLDKLALVLVGAVSAARERVWIMTPYFIPPRELIGALQAAALRGVEVQVLLPGLNNLPFVHWATRKLLWEPVQRGVRVFYQPPPFVHSKVFLVDDHYAQIGSANVDPRSLRLNFELVVEVYDRPFARRMAAHFEAVRARSREVTLEELDSRPLPVRVRDALAWLFSPYL